MNVVTKCLNRRVAAENWSSTHQLDGWRCSSVSAMQKSTHYVAWDCYHVVADCGVFVRIEWRQLTKNPPSYDKQMETALSHFLTSVVASKK
jgi:hypothetical protein